ncbi:MAG: MarR family transcriptional regulator, partial [Rhodospirillales bacterium]|nr:MarR family transcriptional regulator [Rhodospirillales bacterium]
IMDQKTKFTHESAAAMTVMLEAMGFYFRLRDAGKGSGLVTPGGGGMWGFLHSLATCGPQTVPQLARARPVSRQHIQTIANEAEAEGLVIFADNPAHKKSKLVTLTDKGRNLHRQMTELFAEKAQELANGMDRQDLETTARVLNELRSKIAGEKLPLGGLSGPVDGAA